MRPKTQLCQTPRNPEHILFMAQFMCSLPFISGALMQGSNRKTITANSVRLHHHLFKVVGPFQVDVTHGHPWKGMQTCEESPKHKTPLQGGPENPGLTDGLTLTFGLVRIHRQPQNSCPCQPKILTFHTEDAFPLGPG